MLVKLFAKTAVATFLLTGSILVEEKSEISFIEDKSGYMQVSESLSNSWHWGISQSRAGYGYDCQYNCTGSTDNDPYECRNAVQEQLSQCLATATTASQRSSCQAEYDHWINRC